MSQAKLPKPISQTTRVAKAGKQLGEAIVEIVNILYLNDNAREFLLSLLIVLNKEYERRIAAWLKLNPEDIRKIYQDESRSHTMYDVFAKVYGPEEKK